MQSKMIQLYLVCRKINVLSCCVLAVAMVTVDSGRKPSNEQKKDNLQILPGYHSSSFKISLISVCSCPNYQKLEMKSETTLGFALCICKQKCHFTLTTETITVHSTRHCLKRNNKKKSYCAIFDRVMRHAFCCVEHEGSNSC